MSMHIRPAYKRIIYTVVVFDRRSSIKIKLGLAFPQETNIC